MTYVSGSKWVSGFIAAGGGDHKHDPVGRMNGHDPYAYLKDMLTRLPTLRASEIGQLLPHRWTPA